LQITAALELGAEGGDARPDATELQSRPRSHRGPPVMVDDTLVTADGLLQPTGVVVGCSRRPRKIARDNEQRGQDRSTHVHFLPAACGAPDHCYIEEREGDTNSG
jgi:hypothetical protein